MQLEDDYNLAMSITNSEVEQIMIGDTYARLASSFMPALHGSGAPHGNRHVITSIFWNKDGIIYNLSVFAMDNMLIPGGALDLDMLIAIAESVGAG